LYALSEENQIYVRSGRTDTNLAGSFWTIIDENKFLQMDCGNVFLVGVTEYFEVF